MKGSRRSLAGGRVPPSALRLVAWARENVPLYRDLYAGGPEVRTAAAFRRLPVLTPARLRAAPFVTRVDDTNDLLRAFTPYIPATFAAAASPVADRADADAAFEQCRDAFALAGVTAGACVLIMAAPAQRFVAAEMAELLGYWDVQAHVVLHQDDRGVERLVRLLAPERIVGLGTPGTPAARADITVRSPAGVGADLYLVPEAGIVAVRPAGEQAYTLLQHYFLLERSGSPHVSPLHRRGSIEPGQEGANMRSAPLLLTALRRYHQPLIRFALPDRGRVEGGRLWLEEVAP